MPPDPAPRLETALAHAQFVRAVARGVLGGDRDVEDVLQETFLVANEKAPRQPGALRAWLGTVARRLALDRRRSEGRRARRERAAARTEAVPGVEDLLVREETRRRLVEAVARLDEPYRATMLWRYYAGKSIAEIATVLAVPIDTVRTRLQRGLARLREDLDARHGGDRRAWAIALAPLAHGGKGGGVVGTIAGGLAVKKALVAAAVLAALGGGAWVVARSPTAHEGITSRAKPPAMARAPDADATTTGAALPALAAREAVPGASPGGGRATRREFEGVVVGPDGRPIAGADVSVYGFRPGGAAGATPPSLAEGAEASASARTDSDGRFALELTGIPDASMDLAAIVLVTAPDWSPRSAYVKRQGGSTIELARGGVSTVRVTDERGGPVTGARTTWYAGEAPLTADPRAALPAAAGEGRTVSDGRASMRLNPGVYRVRVAAKGRRPVDGDAIAVAEGRATETEVHLDEGIVATFTVVDEAGAPVVGARVRTEGPRRSGGTATTDGEGTCRIPGHALPAPGDGPSLLSRSEIVAYVVEADGFVAGDGYRRLTPAPGPMAIEVRLARGVAVRVRVVDAEGAPIPTAAARWVARPERPPMLEPSQGSGTASPDGWVALPRVRPGPARLWLLAEPEGTYERAWRDVTIGPEGGDLTMALARVDGALSLRVLLADAAPAPATEVAYEPTDVPPAFRVASPSEFTDRDGRVLLERLRCGRGQVLVRGRGRAVQRFPMDVTPRASAAPIEVRLRPTRPIAGRVLARDGKPVPEIGVDLCERPPLVDPAGGHLLPSGLVAQTRTDADGRFRFEVDGDLAYRLAVPGGVWLATGESLDAQANAGVEDLVLNVKPASEGWGLPVRVRATSAGRPYEGRLQLGTTSERGSSFAMELGREAGGGYRFGVAVAPGRHDVTLYAPGHRPTVVRQVALDETPDGTTIDVALDRGAVVRVRVLDGDGRPLAKTWVTLNGSDPVETDGDGECESGGWPPMDKPFALRVALAADPEYTVARTAEVEAPGSTTVTLRRKALLRVSLGIPRREVVADVVLRVVDRAGREEDARTLAAVDAASGQGDVVLDASAWTEGPHRIEVTVGDRRGDATVDVAVGRRFDVRVVWR